MTHDPDNFDNLDNLLKPRPGPNLPDEVFEQTTRTLRRRAQSRRALKYAGLAGLLMGSFALGWLVKPSTINPVAIQNEGKEESASPTPQPAVLNDTPSYATLTPDQLEQKAELSDDPKVVARFYKLAGDAYLARNRYDEALRCYTLHISASKDTVLHRDDSWLLCSVKSTHNK